MPSTRIVSVKWGLVGNTMKKTAEWETYEDVARFVLNDLRDELGMSEFEDKQSIEGKSSGTSWEIDGKGVRRGDETFFLVECRRFTTSRQSQERVAAFAYRIRDTGAAGGFIVSPLGLQKGAQMVAKCDNILSIRLDPDSTTESYFAQYLNQIGMADTYDGANITDELFISCGDQDGGWLTLDEFAKRQRQDARTT